jgi:hypothetical protein
LASALSCPSAAPGAHPTRALAACPRSTPFVAASLQAVASTPRHAMPLPTVRSIGSRGREPLSKEIAMFNRPAKLNTRALAFAAVVTLAMLGFVDVLASHDGQAQEMATTKAAPVATSTVATRA